jgi:hypothetical protein
MKHLKPSERPAANKRGTSLPPPAASLPARRQAAAILEVLAGVHRPLEAAQLLGTSLMRYYQLERRALSGLVAACEPSPRGPRQDPSRQITILEREKARLERECDRQRALVRAAQRALGLTLPSAGNSARKPQPESADSCGAARRRPRRPSIRALRAVGQLRTEETTTTSNGVALVLPVETAAKGKGSSQD